MHEIMTSLIEELQYVIKAIGSDMSKEWKKNEEQSKYYTE